MVCELLKSLCFLSLLLNFVLLMSRLMHERTSGIQQCNIYSKPGPDEDDGSVHHHELVLPRTKHAAGRPRVLCQRGRTCHHRPQPSAAYHQRGRAVPVSTVLLLHCGRNRVCNQLRFRTAVTRYAVSLAVMLYIALWLAASSLPLRLRGYVFTGLLPHISLMWFWDEVQHLEEYGKSLSWSTMTSKHSEHSHSVLAAFVMMWVNTALWFLITWYLDHVRPTLYGQVLPWNFIFKRSYWRKNDVSPGSLLDDTDEPIRCSEDQQYFEPPPATMEAGIKIINVSKVFPKQQALSDVTLDVYRGEITVLLGHNGAGKTTLMSIITGTIPATEGTVLIHGVDVSKNPEEARKHIGLCPQHNIFFANLTVLEHVMFFTMLKGSSYRVARKSSAQLLERLGISDKKHDRTDQLSGGMKRRLQLACALAGDADVLVLDEPTSGLDVETRRGLWDLLLSLRGDCTVVLSTHFMEEADALGDRVAALMCGRLRCLASPLHLKRAVGSGYRLTFTTIGLPKEEDISAVVTAHVPEATVRESNLNSISYNLPAANSDKFPALFENLEYKKPELGLDSIGVGVSTLEEVFLRLCSDVNTSITQDEIDNAEANAGRQFVLMTGARLFLCQMHVLLVRQFKYMLSKKLYFVLLEVLLPILVIALIMAVHRNSDDEVIRGNSALVLNLSVYDTLPEHKVLYDLDDTYLLKNIKEHYPDVVFERSKNISDVVLHDGMKDILEYHKDLIGIQLGDTNATVLYTTLVRHSVPIALNLLSNLVAQREVPWADGRTITVTNHPLDFVPKPGDHIIQPKSLASTIICLVTVVLAVLATCIYAVSLPCKERAAGARLGQRMAGAGAAQLWAAALAARALWAALCVVVPAALLATLDNEHTFTSPSFLCKLPGPRSASSCPPRCSPRSTTSTPSPPLRSCVSCLGRALRRRARRAARHARQRAHLHLPFVPV
ncbi:hypothetical protein ACJJTC_013450 [Scirpophaga incertulas]